MVIVQEGDPHWESHTVTTTIGDAAGGGANDAGVISFDRAGHILCFNTVQRSSIVNTNTNCQALGMITITNATFDQIQIGSFETGFRLQFHKLAGTSGNTVLNFICQFLIRNHRSG